MRWYLPRLRQKRPQYRVCHVAWPPPIHARTSDWDRDVHRQSPATELHSLRCLWRRPAPRRKSSSHTDRSLEHENKERCTVGSLISPVTWLNFESNVSFLNVIAVIWTGVSKAVLPTMYGCSFYYVVQCECPIFSTKGGGVFSKNSTNHKKTTD